MAAIGAFVLVTLGMLAHQEIVKRRQHNPGSEVKEAVRSYALQMEADKKIYQEVKTLKEQGLYADAVVKLENIMQSYPDKSLSYVYLAQVLLKQGKLGDAISPCR